MVLDPHRWLELRRFRSLVESGAISLSEVAWETGLDRKTVRKYLSLGLPHRGGCCGSSGTARPVSPTQ